MCPQSLNLAEQICISREDVALFGSERTMKKTRSSLKRPTLSRHPTTSGMTQLRLELTYVIQEVERRAAVY